VAFVAGEEEEGEDSYLKTTKKGVQITREKH